MRHITVLHISEVHDITGAFDLARRPQHANAPHHNSLQSWLTSHKPQVRGRFLSFGASGERGRSFPYTCPSCAATNEFGPARMLHVS